MSSKIFVKGLPAGLAAEDAKQLLRTKFESATDITVPLAGTDKWTTKGVAFVCFLSAEEAANALSTGPIEINGQSLPLRLANSRETVAARTDRPAPSPTVKQAPSAERPAPSPTMKQTPSADRPAPSPTLKEAPAAEVPAPSPAAVKRHYISLPPTLALLDASCCIATRGLITSAVEGSMGRLLQANAQCQVETVHRLQAEDLTVVVLSRRDAVQKALAAVQELAQFAECRAPTFDQLFLGPSSCGGGGKEKRKRARDEDPHPLGLGDALSALGDAFAGRDGWEGVFMDSAGNLVALRRPSFANAF